MTSQRAKFFTVLYSIDKVFITLRNSGLDRNFGEREAEEAAWGLRRVKHLAE